MGLELESLEHVMLAIDEIVDGGVVIETEAPAVVSRIALRPDTTAANLEALSEQSVADVGMKVCPLIRSSGTLA